MTNVGRFKNWNLEEATVPGACDFQVDNLVVEFQILLGRCRGKFCLSIFFDQPAPVYSP